MDVSTINQLSKTSKPVGEASRAIAELCELYPKNEILKNVKRRIRTVSKDLGLFFEQKARQETVEV